MAISTSGWSQPWIRTLPLVISMASDFPAGSGTRGIWLSAFAPRATAHRTPAAAPESVTAAARTIHTRGLYWRHMRRLAIALSVWATAIRASAQSLPEKPISIAGGHLILGAEITATVAPADPGF